MEKNTWLGIVAIFLVIASIGYALYALPDKHKYSENITSFAECAEAGYPVMESYPRQCRANDGRAFVEEIEAPIGNDLIVTSDPKPNSVVSSPLIVRGEARGGWYFETSFPIEMRDVDGKQLAISYAQAQGEWMTEDFVPFEGKLIWSATSTTATSGVLIFHKDNPSGLPEHDASVEVQVKF